MPKVPYLTRDDKGLKLRRVVPKNLQAAAGRTVWILRLGAMPHEEVKRHAHRFASETDAEIASLRRTAGHRSTVGRPFQACDPVLLPRFDLPNATAESLARTYFAEIEGARLDSGSYFASGVEQEGNSAFLAAKEDHAHAVLTARGAEYQSPEDSGTSTFALACQILASRGIIAPLGSRRLVYPAEVLESPGFVYLCRLLERANVELAKRRVLAFEVPGIPPIGDVLFQPSLEQAELQFRTDADKSKNVGDLVDAFKVQKAREVGASRMHQFKLAVRVLLEELGSDKLLIEVCRSDCQGIADLLVRVPPYLAQHYPNLTMREAAEANRVKNGVDARREVEAQRPIAVVKSIFAFAVDLDWIEVNPASKILLPKLLARKRSRARDDGYQPFELAELKAIFSAPLYTGCLDDEMGFNRQGPHVIKRSRYWVPLLSLLAGLRLNEALQLERRDVLVKDGIDYISINEDASNDAIAQGMKKRLKNANAVRDVPLHPQLRRLGFVEWAESRPSGALFPESLGSGGELASNQFSKRFATFLKSRGIWEPRTKVFHSFRNSFNDALREGEVPKEIREQMLGWSSQRSMDDRYGKGHKLRRLSEEIQKARFEGFDVAHFLSEAEGALLSV